MKSTTRFSKNKKGLECLNCGQPLRGDENFCSECGQVNDEIPLSIKQFISEFFAGFLSFDTRFSTTIVPLLFKPGKVSKEYINGKRRKYTNPFKMYLHTSIVFFLLLGLLSTINKFNNLNKTEDKSQTSLDFVYEELKKADLQLDQIGFKSTYYRKLDSVFKNTDYQKQFNDKQIPRQIKDSLYNTLNDMGLSIKLIDDTLKSEEININEDIIVKAKDLLVKEQLNNYFRKQKIQYKSDNFSILINSIDKDSNFMQSKLVRFIVFSHKNNNLTATKALDSLGVDKTNMNLFTYQKAKDINKLTTNKDFRETYLNAVFSNISIALFFLLPFFTIFFSLLYIRHPYNFTEHLVVVFNLQTVFFLLLILGMLLDLIFKLSIFNAVIAPSLFIFYFYKTLRNFHKQGRFKTVFKLCVLSFIYTLLAIFGLITISFIAFIV